MKLKLFNHTGIAGGLLIYLALLDKSSSKEITIKTRGCLPLEIALLKSDESTHL